MNSWHTAHWLGDVVCTDCHMVDQVPAVGEQLAAADPALAVLTAPLDVFVAIASQNCLDCHAEQVRTTSSGASENALRRHDVIEAAAEAPGLARPVESGRAGRTHHHLFRPDEPWLWREHRRLCRGSRSVLVAARWGWKGGR